MFVTGTDFYEVNYYHLNQNGSQISKNLLFNNANSEKHCRDALFINDNDYLLLLTEFLYCNNNNNTENDNFDYHGCCGVNTTLVKKNLNNDNNKELTIHDIFCSKIEVLSDGYLIFGFWLHDSYDIYYDYFYVAKLNLELELVWQKKIEVGSGSIVPNKRIFVYESESNYYIFFDNRIFILDNSGAFIKKQYFLDVNAEVAGISEVVDGFLWILFNIKSNEINKPSSLFLQIDKSGSILN